MAPEHRKKEGIKDRAPGVIDSENPKNFRCLRSAVVYRKNVDKTFPYFPS